MEVEDNNVALRLLTLLTQNSLAAFHTTLESLDLKLIESDNNIKQVISMEQFFIEGRYNKVLECFNKLDLPHSSELLPQLKNSITDAVADTIQVAYESLAIPYITQILMIDAAALPQFVQQVCFIHSFMREILMM